MSGSRDKEQQAGHRWPGDHSPWGCSSLAWWRVLVCTDPASDLGVGRKDRRGGMFAEKHATLIMGLELIIGRI